jgi:hypothetical protein
MESDKSDKPKKPKKICFPVYVKDHVTAKGVTCKLKIKKFKGDIID